MRRGTRRNYGFRPPHRSVWTFSGIELPKAPPARVNLGSATQPAPSPALSRAPPPPHRKSQNGPQDQAHRHARHRAPHRAGRHAVGRHRRDGQRSQQRRRPGHHHRPDAADAGRAAEGDRAVQEDDQQAVRCEPHHPALDQPPAVRGVHRRHHRVGHQGRRDRRQQPRPLHQEVQGGRVHRHPQVHLDPPRAHGAAPRRGRALGRRLRVRRPPRRGRRARADPAGQGRQGAQDPVHRLGRHGRRARAGCRPRPRRRGCQHGHPLHVHRRVPRAPVRQGGHGQGRRAPDDAHVPPLPQHLARVQEQGRRRGQQAREPARGQVRGREGPRERPEGAGGVREGRHRLRDLVRRPGRRPDRRHPHVQGPLRQDGPRRRGDPHGAVPQDRQGQALSVARGVPSRSGQQEGGRRV